MLFSGSCACTLTLALLAQPATSAPASQPELETVAIHPGAQPHGGSYWLMRPEGYGPADRPALLIVLHGSDDTALDAARFWSSRRHELPFLLVAHQALGIGWSQGDLPLLTAMLADVRKRAPFDEQRILLAGFSAGGAMAMHLLYAQRWPLCAAAALANYVPPPLTPDQIRSRREVPVFYAVGMKDINHERMRVGIELLRTCGANIDLYRPPVGHVLDPQVGQAALDWLLLRARRAVAERLDAVKNEMSPEAAALVEEIVAQGRWHDRANVESAARALARIEAPGLERLQRARTAMRDYRPLDAIKELEDAESDCLTARLKREMADLRQSLLNDPAVEIRRQEVRRDQERDQKALALYAGAQRLVAARKFQEALARCEEVIQQYGDTPAAQRARFLADLLRSKSLAQ